MIFFRWKGRIKTKGFVTNDKTTATAKRNLCKNVVEVEWLYVSMMSALHCGERENIQFVSKVIFLKMLSFSWFISGLSSQDDLSCQLLCFFVCAQFPHFRLMMPFLLCPKIPPFHFPSPHLMAGRSPLSAARWFGLMWHATRTTVAQCNSIQPPSM